MILVQDQIGGTVKNYVCLASEGTQQGVANLKICCKVEVEQASCYDQNRPSGTCNSNRDCLAGEEFCMQAINENGKVVTNQHYCCSKSTFIFLRLFEKSIKLPYKLNKLPFQSNHSNVDCRAAILRGMEYRCSKHSGY